MFEPMPIKPKHTPKYVKGGEFTSVQELWDWLYKRGRWVFIRGKLYHPAWAMNMSMWTLTHLDVYKAELNQDWKEEVERTLRHYE